LWKRDIDLSAHKHKDPIAATTQAFEKLLRLFYKQRFAIATAAQLLEITNVAETYAALPALSKTLSATLYQNRNVFREIDSWTSEVLEAATTLRHPQLFLDALVISLGPWESLEYRRNENRKHKRIAEKAHNRLCATILSVNRNLLTELASEDGKIVVRSLIDGKPRSVSQIRSDIRRKGQTCLPSFYRNLLTASSTPSVQAALRNHIAPLMRNNLILYPGEGAHKEFKDHFLCVTIADNELPWTG
jgi:hypothetical protein